MNCLDCEDRERVATATVHLCEDSNPYRTHECRDPECTAWLCEDCSDIRAERAYENSLSDYYGGSGPQTLNEQCAAARAIKDAR